MLIQCCISLETFLSHRDHSHVYDIDLTRTFVNSLRERESEACDFAISIVLNVEYHGLMAVLDTSVTVCIRHGTMADSADLPLGVCLLQFSSFISEAIVIITNISP